MEKLKNERGSVLVFVTLMIVLLMIMVGMGMDTGVLTFTRATGQGAVDAAALSAVSALPSKNATEVENRASAAFLSVNNYTNSSGNPISNANVSYVKYDFGSNQVTQYGVAIGVANGVRVALEAGSAMKTPAFLTPFLNLFGSGAAPYNNVSVSAVAVVNSRPTIPIALWSDQCSGSATKPDVVIRVQPPSEENSCWTTYLDKSSGGSDIEDLFKASGDCNGIPTGEIGIGVPIYENKGGVTSVYDAAKDLFLVNPATKDRCWIIPVINPPVGRNCNAKDPAPIVDWAEICPTEVSKGSDKYIKASVTCNRSLNESTASLCFSHRLVREHGKGM
jgi:Flp pilus assembly protein TadG